MVRRAGEFGVTLVNGSDHAGKPGYPVIDGRRWGMGEQDVLLDDLAGIFGVSPSFIWVRLRKYRLVTGQGRA
jgi:hypothetical protein